MSTPVKRLGELLIERGKLDAGSLDRALRLQQDSGERLGALLVTLGLVAPRDVAEALAAQLGLPMLDGAGYPELPILEERVSSRFLRDAHALPVREDADELVLAMADPTDRYAIDAFAMVTGRRVRPMVAVPGELDAALERLYGSGKSAMGQIVGDDVEMRGDEIAFDADVQQLKDLASEAPVIRLVNLLITSRSSSARPTSTSSPSRTSCVVRYRIDGVLHEIETPPRRLPAADHLARQDHGEPQHRRAPAAAGRAHQAARAGQGDRPARVDPADAVRRERRDADPRPVERRARPRRSSASSTTRSSASSRR